MFNLKDMTTALRFCAVGVLFFASATSHAWPAHDDHIALRNEATTTLPDTREECRLSARASSVVAFHNSECERECGRVFDLCRNDCGGSKWCSLLCSASHAFCTYGCNSGTGP